MTRDDIIRLAREAGLALYVNDVTEEPYALTLERFAALVAAAEQKPISDVTEAVTKTVIDVEKLLCEKIGRQWQASGMSIQTLVDELATLVAEREREACAIAGGAAAMAGLDHLQVAAAIRARGET